MRTLALAVVFLHLAAVSASSGISFCRGAEHSIYEWDSESCCQDEEDCCEDACLDEACGEHDAPALQAPPPCGSCEDSLQILSSGLKVTLAAVALIPSTRVPGPSADCAEVPAPVSSRPRLTPPALRC